MRALHISITHDTLATLCDALQAIPATDLIKYVAEREIEGDDEKSILIMYGVMTKMRGELDPNYRVNVFVNEDNYPDVKNQKRNPRFEFFMDENQIELLRHAAEQAKHYDLAGRLSVADMQNIPHINEI